MIERRLARLYAMMDTGGVDGIIVTKPENRHYFSGFTGSAGVLLISRQTQKVLTDFRYIEQANQQAPLYQVVRQERPSLRRWQSIAGTWEWCVLVLKVIL